MESNKERWQCRWSPTLGELEDTHQEIWRTSGYKDEDEIMTDVMTPTVFFGLYGFPDFYKLWRHKGRKCILWAGTDIIHFSNGYWLDTEGKMRIHPTQLSAWIDTYCESYVENEVERNALRNVGIRSKVVPSFLGDVAKFPCLYKENTPVRLYTSVSGDNFLQYGWDKIEELALQNPTVEFHLYGNIKLPLYRNTNKNILIHGRISKEHMNSEIQEMTGALRLTTFDGFSEIVAKSLLWGQWPVSLIEYPHTVKPENIDMLFLAKEPNYKGREWLLSVVNRYPWNSNV